MQQNPASHCVSRIYFDNAYELDIFVEWVEWHDLDGVLVCFAQNLVELHCAFHISKKVIKRCLQSHQFVMLAALAPVINSRAQLIW